MLGNLVFHASLDRVYWALVSKFTVILGLNFVKKLAMAVVIIFLFHRIVGRHLIDFAGHLSSLSLDRQTSDVRLSGRRKDARADELDRLASIAISSIL